ncbi:ribonuclease J [Mycoplasmopsis edwardii]|uniref:Ribonuclease J n=1 Tax=Mycoplasmopsis edwardii TaxID=53558 RepID=A0ACD4PHN2_9BACT|nr:ribonuclease J [Mycoplasmopsis edwardii]WBP84172.1 ribonuclease J [Mycoplasmopsis edwardii]
MENVRIFALGGQDENGKNSYVFAHEEDLYVINAGVKVPINSQNGVDTLIPDFTHLEKNKDKIKGIFISDIRNESFSALPWLIMKVPGLRIYTSQLSKEIILERLSKYGIKKDSYKIIVLDERKKIGNIYVQPISLPGSVPGNIGFDFITKTGDYVFMFNFVEGDLDIFGRTWFLHLPKLFNKRKVVALVSDAGKTNFNGRAIDKNKLPDSITKTFETAKNNERIIVGAYSEDMVSLHKILKLAIKHKRPVVTYGKTYADLLEITKKLADQLNKPLELPEIIDYKQISKNKNAVVLVTGAIERLFSRFLRITSDEDVYLKLLSSDNIIMIAPPVNGLESQAAFTLDEIARVSKKLIDVADNEYFYCRPYKDDILNLIKNLKPNFFVPAQGLYRYLTDAANHVESDDVSKETQSIVLLNGKILHFQDGHKISHSGKIKEVGDVIVDGFGVGDISSEVIAEREVLGREGVIIINSLYDAKQRKIIGKLHINYVGVIDGNEQEEMNKLIKSVIIELISGRVYSSMFELNEKVRKSIRKKIFKTTGKEPLVALTLTQV